MASMGQPDTAPSPDIGPDATPDAAPPDAGCMPSAERCNGLDDDCDGRIDEVIAPVRDPTLVDANAAYRPILLWSDDGQGLAWDTDDVAVSWSPISPDGLPGETRPLVSEPYGNLSGLATHGERRYAVVRARPRIFVAALGPDGHWVESVIELGRVAGEASIASTDDGLFTVHLPGGAWQATTIVDGAVAAQVFVRGPSGPRALAGASGPEVFGAGGPLLAIYPLDLQTGDVGDAVIQMTTRAVLPDVAEVVWTGASYVAAWLESDGLRLILHVARYRAPAFTGEVLAELALPDALQPGRISIRTRGDDVYLAWPASRETDSPSDAGVFVLGLRADGGRTGPVTVTDDPAADYGWAALRPLPEDLEAPIFVAWSRLDDGVQHLELGAIDFRCPE